MFSFLVKTCTNCDNLEDAICAIDGVLAQYGKNAWQNTAFMTIKPIPHVKMRQLLYYKEILNNLRWNQDFYCPYGFDVIVSRVKALTGGEFRIARRMKIQPQNPLTTTTTTSTSTTTTTSTSTSTSTTTTTSTSTSTTTSTSTSTTTSTSTSSTSTTSTTTTTTTTALPQLIAINNALVGTVTLLAITYDRYPPNDPQPSFGAFPVIAGQTKTTGIQPSFIPGSFFINVDADPFGSISIEGSDGTIQCQDFTGLSVYTFTGVVVNLSNPVTITIHDVGVSCVGLENAVIVCDGNSLTYGTQSSDPITKSYPAVLQTLSPFSTNGTVITNKGIAGQTTDDMITDGATDIDPLYDPSVTSIVIAWEIGNDLYYTGDVAAAQAKFQTYCEDRLAAGWVVVSVTLPYRDHSLAGGFSSAGDSDVVYNAKRATINTWLRANYGSFSSALVDLDANPNFSSYNATYFSADHIHLNDAGYALVADLVKTTLLNL